MLPDLLRHSEGIWPKLWPALYQQFRLMLVVQCMGGIFLAHAVADHDAIMSQSLNHLKLISLT